MSRSVLVVAGDVSGDMHAAGVVRAIHESDPSIAFFGIGGEALRSAGANILYDCREMSVFGLPAVVRRYRFFKRVFERMVNEARERRPDAALLVDYGGFNIRYARRLRELGIKVLYYICPQVWASRRSRIRQIAAYVDRLMTIFPFEPALFGGTGLRVDFVGHPLVDAAREVLSRPEEPLPWSGSPRIALLPGSRGQEVARLLPVMLEAAKRIQERWPDAAFVIPTPSADVAELVRDGMRAAPSLPRGLEVIEGGTREALRQARAAWVASGTATIEAMLMRCPMVVVYKASWPFYLLGRMLVRVPHIGMVNIVAGRLVCPELIQGRATARALSRALVPLVDETPQRAEMLAGLLDATARLGEGGAAERAAHIVLEELSPPAGAVS